MKQYRRYVDGWCISMNIYANRTQVEGEVADFVDCTFKPNMTVEQLKVKVERYIKTLPVKHRDRFQVNTWAFGPICNSSGEVSLGRFSVRYGKRWVVCVREQIDKPVKP